MGLPFVPPLSPMLARLARELPRGDDVIYEPKWDGFRCLAFRDGDKIELQSRNKNPFGRYFPEIVESLTALADPNFVVDGEIIVTSRGQPDFSALLARLHPAESRVERLRHETPAYFLAFDLVAYGDRDLTQVPFSQRRELLEHLLSDAEGSLRATPITADPDVAQAWLDGGKGIDGIIVKRQSMTYDFGKRAMLKVKLERTADCIVGGFRWHQDKPLVGSLLLGVYDEDVLRHIGLAASFRAENRLVLTERVLPYITELDGHPWQDGFNLPGGPIGRLPGAASAWSAGGSLTWVPLRPELVCEVAYEHIERYRFRHPARFRRWRPDRDPRSCTYEQLETVDSPQ